MVNVFGYGEHNLKEVETDNSYSEESECENLIRAGGWFNATYICLDDLEPPYETSLEEEDISEEFFKDELEEKSGGERLWI